MNPRPPSSGLVGFRIVLVTDISVVALLDDPVRRRLYDYVAAQGAGVSRSEAAQAAGIGRTLAAFHLDRLAEAGLDRGTVAPAGARRPDGRPARAWRGPPGQAVPAGGSRTPGQRAAPGLPHGRGTARRGRRPDRGGTGVAALGPHPRRRGRPGRAAARSRAARRRP